MTTIDTAIARRPWISGRKPLPRPGSPPAPSAAPPARGRGFRLLCLLVALLEVDEVVASSLKGRGPNVVASSRGLRRAASGRRPPETLDATQFFRKWMGILGK